MSKSTNRYGKTTFHSKSALSANVVMPLVVKQQQDYLNRVAVCLFSKSYFRLKDKIKTLLHGILNNWDAKDAKMAGNFDFSEVLAGRQKLAAAKLL